MNFQSLDLNEFVTNNLTDKEVAREFLNASLETYLEDGDFEEFLRSLKLVIQANPLLAGLETHLQTASQFGTMVTLLSKLGLRLKIASWSPRLQPVLTPLEVLTHE